jgi:flavin reductase (DIM6/NTAB) family NADH-FMN oxidoreductase RutF
MEKPMTYVDISFAEFTEKAHELLAGSPWLLATASSQGKPNVMTVGATGLGTAAGVHYVVEWVKPSCYTSELIEETREFTLNVPREGMGEVVRSCGSVSGRDRDKFAEANLTAIPSKIVSAPILQECGIHLECKLTGIWDARPESITGSSKAYYERSGTPAHNYHRCYFAEIVAIYADKDVARRLW